jgi:anti-sigma B factor antagonist
MTSSGPSVPAPFDVHVSGSNRAMTARLVGELDLVTVPAFEQRLERMRHEGARQLTLDLADLSFIDSTGLSALVTALKRYRADGGDIVLRSPTRATTKVLEISGLSQVFTIESGPPTRE